MSAPVRLRKRIRHAAVSGIATGISRTVLAVLSFAGLTLSTVAVTIMARAVAALSTTTRTLCIEVASLAAFGTVWVVQFALLDRMLFGHGQPVPDVPVPDARVPDVRVSLERSQDVSCVR